MPDMRAWMQRSDILSNKTLEDNCKFIAGERVTEHSGFRHLLSSPVSTLALQLWLVVLVSVFLTFSPDAFSGFSRGSPPPTDNLGLFAVARDLHTLFPETDHSELLRVVLCDQSSNLSG